MGSGAESAKVPSTRKLQRKGVGGFLAENPLADERLRRIAGLHPYTAERGDVTRRKIENDFGHDILLPAHVPA
jgi:hypothetical protein